MDMHEKKTATRIVATTFMIGLATAMLSACAAPGPFDGPATSLPAGFDADHYVADSIHELGTDAAGYTYYAATSASGGADRDAQCLLVASVADGAITAGCSALPVTVGFRNVSATLYPQAHSNPNGAEMVGEFVSVIPR